MNRFLINMLLLLLVAGCVKSTTKVVKHYNAYSNEFIEAVNELKESAFLDSILISTNRESCVIDRNDIHAFSSVENVSFLMERLPIDYVIIEKTNTIIFQFKCSRGILFSTSNCPLLVYSEEDISLDKLNDKIFGVNRFKVIDDDWYAANRKLTLGQ